MKILDDISEIITLWLCITALFLFIGMNILFYEYFTYGIFGDYNITEFLIGEAIYWDKPWWYTWIRALFIPTVITAVLVIGWNFGKTIQKYKCRNL